MPPVSPSLVTSVLTDAVSVSVGGSVVMLIRPAEADLPYSVLCGPRSTSICAMSDKSVKARGWKAIGMSSTTTATLGSTPMEKANVPTPRMVSEAFTGFSAGLITNDGATRLRSLKSRMS